MGLGVKHTIPGCLDSLSILTVPGRRQSAVSSFRLRPAFRFFYSEAASRQPSAVLLCAVRMSLRETAPRLGRFLVLGLTLSLSELSSRRMATPAPDAVKRLVDQFDQNRDAYLPGSWSLVSGFWFQEPRTKNQEPRMDRFQDADKRHNSGLFDFRKDTVTPSLKIDDKLLSDILSERSLPVLLAALYPPKSPYEFSVIASSVHSSWSIVPGTEGRKPRTKNREPGTSVVIRLTAGHQAKVEEKPESPVPVRAFASPARFSTMSVMESEPSALRR
jgi:hypothetical protein